MVERAMRGTYYGWAQMYLLAVQRQLNHARESGGGFCFGSFLCAFFFEKVPTRHPHKAVWDSGLWELQMRRRCQMMVREGGGRVGCFFTEEFLEQWHQLPVVIEEYPYVGMDYHGDPEMPRPLG